MERLWSSACPVLLGMLLVTTIEAGEPVIWVGADPVACDNDNLPTAVAGAPHGAIIRIANDQSYQDMALQVVGKSLELHGGYANCQDAVPAGWTQLRGVPDQASYVFAFIGGYDGESDPFQLELSNLEIRGGENDSGGGGGVLLVDAMWATLRNVDILGHHAAEGAGLKVMGPAGPGNETVVILDNVNIGPAVNVAVLRNRATGNGGGLWCQSAAILVDEANIRYNRASGSGAGAWLDNCLFRVRTTDKINRVAHNESFDSGGGFYLVDSTVEVQLLLEIVLPNEASRGVSAAAQSFLVIAHNYADLDGGGIFANSSFITLAESPVIGNEADGGVGAGLYLVGGSQATMRSYRPFGPHCLSAEPTCTVLADNTSEFNGGVSVSGGSQFTINRGWIRGNQATMGGTLFRAGGAGSRIRVFDSLVTDNTASWMMLVGTQAEGHLAGATLAGNNVGNSVLRSSDNAGLVLENSIFWEPGEDLFSGDGNLLVRCTNAHDDSANASLETHDPGFANPLNGDYRLRTDSLNIDRCTEPTVQLAPFQDLLGTPRPQYVSGDSGDPDLPYDRGAFEFVDFLFHDRFELLP